MQLSNVPERAKTPLQGLAEGIYFGLDEDRYHAAPALGSTDIRGIIRDAEAWWKSSKLNPNIAEREAYKYSTKATILGKAMHLMALEGGDAFRAKYVRRPDDLPGARREEKARLTVQSKAALLPHQYQLHGDEWDVVMRTEQLIKSHPDLKTSLWGGQNEVSVFVRRPDGIMVKARFDRLKPFGIGDLKSIENEYHKRLEDAALWDIGTRGYDIQCCHYLEVRSQMFRLFNAGKVYMVTVNGDIETADTSSIVQARACYQLAKECAETARHVRLPNGDVRWAGDRWVADHDSHYAFIFIFLQKSAPGIWAGIFAPDDDAMRDAWFDIERACKLYAKNIETIPAGTPWPPSWRLRYISQSDLPPFYRNSRWKDQ